ncbi:hypothetical protein C4588_02765 [Candidatus Parcubacteria bacterium]|nr:MAG: hypothetical protein C4588_02765 [Candidatus Parcubacteria bacterium]
MHIMTKPTAVRPRPLSREEVLLRDITTLEQLLADPKLTEEGRANTVQKLELKRKELELGRESLTPPLTTESVPAWKTNLPILLAAGAVLVVSLMLRSM